MFCIDLDRFKLVNDSLGHEAGDRLLIEVARRLRETLRAADTVARLGDDEFMVLCEDCPDSATARVVAQRLNDALSVPVELDGRPVYTSGSIGVLLPGEIPAGAEEVMRDADAAMHAAKRRGKGRAAVFDAGMRGRAMERLEPATSPSSRPTASRCVRHAGTHLQRPQSRSRRDIRVHNAHTQAEGATPRQVLVPWSAIRPSRARGTVARVASTYPSSGNRGQTGAPLALGGSDDTVHRGV